MSANDSYHSNYPKSEDFDILAHPMYWVASLNSLYFQTMEKRLKPMGMDVARWRIAMILRAYGEISVSTASHLAVNRLSTTTKLVQRMEKEGLLNSYKDSKDERVTLISLTQAGRDLLEEALIETHYIFPKIFQGISPEEAEAFVNTMKKMSDNLKK